MHRRLKPQFSKFVPSKCMLTAVLGILAGILACKSPPAAPDTSRQKLIQVAVLLSYDHPAAYQNIQEGLQQAMGELDQINAVIFGQAASRKQKLANRKTQVQVRLKNNYVSHSILKKQQIRQIIAQGFDVLVLFGDELLDLDSSLLEAQRAGLVIIYCGFTSKPLISLNALAAPAQTQNPPPYTAANTAPPKADEPNYLLGSNLLDPIPSGKQQSLQSQPGLVHVNIRATSIARILQNFTQFLQGNNVLGSSQPFSSPKVSTSSLLLFGPAELPSTRRLYSQMRKIIYQNQDYIQAVRFLDPMSLESQNQLRSLILQLPASGRIIAMEALLFYSSSQILQRYGAGIKIAGLGWQNLNDPLLASSNIQLLGTLKYKPLVYAALHAAFALYSKQKQGKIGEIFLLGSYGQRQIEPDGSLVLNNFYASRENLGVATVAEVRPRFPSRVPRKPNRATRLSEGK